MGTNTDAILFYGIHADADAWNEALGEDLDWKKKYVSVVHGRDEPTVVCDMENVEIWKSYWDFAAEKVKESYCEVDAHCSGDYQMPYVFVKESRVVANRGEPEQISSLSVPAYWDYRIKEFCDVLGIPCEQPKWWLVSNWEH